VTLPVSGRHYAIARPSGEGRDSLFEQAKADPERQMPYWAKVWPSGVALADVVAERAAEVRDRQVLELGAGLGVTACTVLEEGGRLITADYSLLPLALCRLNGLLNTGRAPGSTCFNWRDEAQVRDVLRRHPSIGLILAADVLYEFRDIQPLIDVIERLLAPAGSLWLAEPVRRTAQRFLDIIATMGWTIESRRIRAQWPDATDGWVNVHVIRRENEPTEMALALGGGQL
jgi:predicted nicotinamide N-methyase